MRDFTPRRRHALCIQLKSASVLAYPLVATAEPAAGALSLHSHDAILFFCITKKKNPPLFLLKVYYVGPNARKVDAVPGAPRNGGYDDATGRYRGRLMDHIAYR